jgi:hypothetical protein
MRRGFYPIAVIAACLLLLSVPATASAAPWLTGSEARREIRQYLQDPAYFEYGLDSMRAFCWRLAPNWVRCGVGFRDLDGDQWGGRFGVKEYRTAYSTKPLRLDCLSDCFE